MAKKYENQQKQQIYIEYKSNYDQAVNELDKVKNAVGDNADELKELQKAQEQLTNAFKKFENELNNVDNSLDDITSSSSALKDSMNQLDSSISGVNSKFNSFNSSSKKVETGNADLNKSVDKSADSHKKLGNEVESNNQIMLENAGVVEILDEHTAGLTSRIINLLGLQNGFKAALTGNAEAFAQMSSKAKLATVATNGFSLAMKALAAATLLGALIAGLQYVSENWDEIIEKVKRATNAAYDHSKAIIDVQKELRKNLDLEDLTIERKKLAGATAKQIAIFEQEQAQKRLKSMKLEMAQIQLTKVNALKATQEIQLFFDSIYGNIYKSVGYAVKQVENTINMSLFAANKLINSFKGTAVGKFFGLEDDNKDTFSQISLGSELLLEIGNESIAEARAKYAKQNLDEWLNSDEYQEFQTNLATLEEKIAAKQNEINDLNKKAGEEAKKQAEEAKKALEELQKKQAEVQHAINQMLNDENIRLSTDSIDKKVNENIKSLTELEYEKKQKLSELKETFKVGSEDFIKFSTQIESTYNARIKSLGDENDELRKLKETYVGINEELKTGKFEADKMLKKVEEFIKEIDNDDLKLAFGEMFNIEHIREVVSLLTEVEQVSPFEVDENKSKKQNLEIIDSVFERNQEIIKNEYETQLELIGNAAEFEQARLDLKKKFDKKFIENEKSRSKAVDKVQEVSTRDTMQKIEMTIGAVGQLGEALGAGFEVQKGISAANTIVSTIAATMGALETYKGSPMAWAVSGTIIASGLASLITILKTTPQNATEGGGAAMGSIESGMTTAQPNVQFMQSSESQLQTTINGQIANQNQPIQAVVSNKNITTNQQLYYQQLNNSSL